MPDMDYHFPLPALSLTPSDPGFLVNEWRFTGCARDNLGAGAECAICGRHHLRYQYQIQNRHTHHTSWAGESCLLHSGIIGYVNGNPVSGDDLKPAIRDARQAMAMAMAVSSLEGVAAQNGHPALSGALATLKESGFVSPKQAAAIFYAASKEGLGMPSGLMKVTLKRKKHQEQVIEMDEKLFALLIEGLDTQSRATAEKIRGRSEER